MKKLLENWQTFLTESLVNIYQDELEYSEDGDIVLYHVSSNKNLTVLDPDIAAGNIKGYTKREYREWDKPRVFFFTKVAQEDLGVGKISGTAYKAKVNPDELYPLYKDPKGYSHPPRIAQYKQIRKEEDNIPSYHPVNTWELVWYFANQDGFKGFIYPQAQGENLIVSMWNLVDVEPLDYDFYK
tara:strand:+ start:11358 stop:11909 length:552 start_codon:yes stop_codon:yes gene_type:complete